jgi:hypothetical protein
MKEITKTLELILEPLRADGRIGPVHISMYLALLHCSGGRSEWFAVERKEVMRLAKVKGKTTYYKVMGELAGMGYVEYRGARNGGSRVRMVRSLRME